MAQSDTPQKNEQNTAQRMFNLQAR